MIAVLAYVVRHQKAGHHALDVFALPPTDEQVAAIKARLDASHGSGWARAVPVTLHVPDELAAHFEPVPTSPPVQEAASPDGGATGALVEAPPIRIVAVGSVEPPRGG